MGTDQPMGTTYSLESARRAAADDDLNRWVAEFLASPGSDNPVLAEQLSQPPRSWAGPVRVPLDQLHRLAGPPGDPVLVPTPEEEWRDDVDEMRQLVEEVGTRRRSSCRTTPT